MKLFPILFSQSERCGESICPQRRSVPTVATVVLRDLSRFRERQKPRATPPYQTEMEDVSRATLAPKRSFVYPEDSQESSSQESTVSASGSSVYGREAGDYRACEIVWFFFAFCPVASRISCVDVFLS